MAEDFSAYSPGRTHRHVGEIEAVLADRTGQRVELTFCPHLLPVKRGILTALYVKPKADLAELKRALETAYDGASFVQVVDGARRACRTWSRRTTAGSPSTRPPPAAPSSSPLSTTS